MKKNFYRQIILYKVNYFIVLTKPATGIIKYTDYIRIKIKIRY